MPVTGAKPNPFIDSHLLKSHVATLSETLPPRMGHETALQATIEWIEKQLKPFGTLKRQNFIVKGETFTNIIISFGPVTNKRIIVGAHYDTYNGLPGADDNASGVAALIELARLLSTTNLNIQVDLVAFTLEEPPYFRTENMGSYIHANEMKDKHIEVQLMIAIDMIGYYSTEPDSQHFNAPLVSHFYPDRGDFIALIGNLSNMGTIRKVKKSFKQASQLPVYSFNAPTLFPGVDFSDHLNYWNNDFPAIMVTDTAFSRNLNYHTIEDTAEKLDYDKMAQVIHGLYQTVLNYSK